MFWKKKSDRYLDNEMLKFVTPEGVEALLKSDTGKVRFETKKISKLIVCLSPISIDNISSVDKLAKFYSECKAYCKMCGSFTIETHDSLVMCSGNPDKATIDNTLEISKSVQMKLTRISIMICEVDWGSIKESMSFGVHDKASLVLIKANLLLPQQFIWFSQSDSSDNKHGNQVQTVDGFDFIGIERV